MLREQRQREELVAHVLRKFLARRDLAIAVGGNHQFHFREDLEHDGYANGDLELAIADVSPGYANRADKAFQCKRYDGFIGNGEQHVLHHGNRAPADPFLAALVREQHINGNGNRALHARELRAVAQAVDGEVRNRAFRGRGAAAFKRPLSTGLWQRAIGIFRVFHGLRIGKGRAAGVAAARAGVSSTGTAARAGIGFMAGFVGQNGNDVAHRDHHVIELLLLHAGIIDVFHLDADALVQPIERAGANATGRALRIGVFVAVE